MSDRGANSRGGLRGWLFGLLSRAFRGRPDMTIGKWAESVGLNIPADESHALPGPYREDSEPVATIVHQFLQDPRYRVFIGPKPSRMGYTLAAIVAIAYWLTHFACDIIFCIDDQRQVKKFARKRLIPLLRSVKSIADILPASKRALTNTVLWFKGVTLHLAGARSIADVTSITAGLVIGDEVDQWKDFASGEASAFWHLLDRIMDVPGAKAVFFGKPRNETDILWTQYLTGTRHTCFVPCPHCGHMQPLKWENLVFEHCKQDNGNYDIERMKREIYYRCASPACQASEAQGIIRESHKEWMVRRHEWRQTYFGDDPDYQLDPVKMSVTPAGQIYSLRPELTWGNIAAHFITARKEGGVALAHFFRTRFGEPERKAQAVTKKEEINALSHYAPLENIRKWGERLPVYGGTVADIVRRPYQHGECPFAPCVVLMFCDVQTVLNEKKWVKMGFRVNGEAAIIDYGIYRSFDRLIEEADKPVKVVDWGNTPKAERVDPVVRFCWIDEGGTNSGSERNEILVREFCARPETMDRFFPAKGAGGLQIKAVVEEHSRTTNAPDGSEVTIVAYHFSHDTFASELFYRRIKKHEEILLAIAQGITPEAQPLWAPAFLDDQFVTEMCSEILVKKRVRGRTEYVWEKTGRRVNDFPDGVKGCFGMWHNIKGLWAGEEEEAAASPPVPPEEENALPREREYLLHR